tara:strand:- start:4121 stop:4633 length:513 start_codon:yes stop_codon:yes gene_type:complete
MDNIFYNLDCPRLDIGSRVGGTQYIDFIKCEEVTGPIVKGYDCFGRKFIVIKFIVKDRKIMQTFFQRYSDSNGWMGCGHATVNLMETPGYINKKQINLLQDIINNKVVEIEEDHKPSIQDFIGKKVMLYDKKRIDSAIIIQRAWIKCRYNPQYEMCSKVQDRNMKELLEN